MSKPKKLYRCVEESCEVKEFWSELPVCPGCEADGRKPEDRGIIQQLATIHFDPPSGRKDKGKNHRACDPKTPIFGGMATGEPASVTCMACKQTEVYRRVAEEYGYDVSQDAEQPVTRRSSDTTPPISPCH